MEKKYYNYEIKINNNNNFDKIIKNIINFYNTNEKSHQHNFQTAAANVYQIF